MDDHRDELAFAEAEHEAGLQHSSWLGRHRGEIAVIALFLALPALVYFASMRRGPDISGFYLVAAGQGFMEIDRTASGYRLESLHWSFWDSATDWQVRPRSGGFALIAADKSWTGGSAILDLEFRRNAGGEDAFDLTFADLIPLSSNYFAQAWQRLRSNFAPAGKAPSPPLRAFLHRVDDEDARGYMQLVLKEPKPAMPGHALAPSTTSTLFNTSMAGPQLLTWARGMLDRHPRDAYTRLLYLDALLRVNQPDELTQRITEWGADLKRKAVDDPIIGPVFERIQLKATGLAAAASGQNAYGDVLTMLAPDTTLQQQLAVFLNLEGRQAFTPPGGYTLPTAEVMDYLRTQSLCKVAAVGSWMSLFAGDTTRALNLAVCNVRYSQLEEDFDSYLITRLIAVAMRNLASRSLTEMAVNAPLSLSQAKEFHERVEDLAARVKTADSFRPEGDLPVPLPGGLFTPNYDEVDYRIRVAASEFQLARVAVALRLFLLESGKLPDAPFTELAASLRGKIPADPFSLTSAPLHLKTDVASQTLVAYSEGPDQKDDAAGMEYDSTNGTVSRGDIVMRFPAKPEYPVPPDGLHGETTHTLLAQLPSGLPEEYFRWAEKVLPFGTAQSNAGVLIFSVGPDRKPNDYATTITAPEQLIMYDPTNGTVSEGDLILPVRR
jgi:hypothetical protein